MIAFEIDDSGAVRRTAWGGPARLVHLPDPLGPPPLDQTTIPERIAEQRAHLFRIDQENVWLYLPAGVEPTDDHTRTLEAALRGQTR